MRKIKEIAEEWGILEDELELYGHYMAKIDLKIFERLKDRKDGKLIIVTAITPTKYGEGKTTTSIGLSMALNKLGKRAWVTLREPSLGPCFGIKGGATGGGKSTVEPSDEINLHFTSDFHRVSIAHNLLSALIDNHIHHGNELRIDSRRVWWPRTVDLNERALRKVIVGLGGKSNGFPREDGFIITSASEIMAILGLVENLKELKEKLGNIVVGVNLDNKPVFARDLKAVGSLTALLKDAIKPNLVQTSEGTPAFVHIGPFANIAHGTNSIIATKLALKLADYVITETGFGSDLGFEKFMDIVAPKAGFKVSAGVIVASVRALKLHGNDNLEKGLINLKRHVENVRNFGVEPVVAVNVFPEDTEEEGKMIIDYCKNELKVRVARNKVYDLGSEGGIELAEAVLDVIENQKQVKNKTIYKWDEPLEDKIEKVARYVYGADSVDYTKGAKTRLKWLKKNGFDKLPICIAKTQYSWSDNPKMKGSVISGFSITINDIKLSSGAGFVVPIAGDIMLMPGLPKEPAAYNIDVDEKTGEIIGLF